MEDEDGEKKTTRMPCVVVDEFQMLDTIPDVDAETTEQVRHALRTVELKTAEMDIVEERFVGETAEDDDTAPTEAVPVARAGLASETNVLLDAIEQGAARSVIVVCEGSASDRPRVPPAELAMALAEAHVAVAQQLLDGVVDDGGGEAGARIARLRQMLDHDSE